MGSLSKNSRILIALILAFIGVLVVLPLVIAGAIWTLAILVVLLLLAVPIFLAMKRRAANVKQQSTVPED